MTEQRIVLTFNEEGEVEIEAMGFVGTSCATGTQFLEEALGAETLEEQKKAEWWLQNGQSVANTLQNTGIDTSGLCG